MFLFFFFCDVAEKRFDFFSFSPHFPSYLSSLRWISTIPKITRAFIGASLLSTHCLADTQRERARAREESDFNNNNSTSFLVLVII